jgi:hypothetical protein
MTSYPFDLVSLDMAGNRRRGRAGVRGLLRLHQLCKHRCSVSPPIASHGVHNLRFPHKSHGGWRLVCLTKHFISYDVGSR